MEAMASACMAAPCGLARHLHLLAQQHEVFSPRFSATHRIVIGGDNNSYIARGINRRHSHAAALKVMF
jgi:hypothetical protein